MTFRDEGIFVDKKTVAKAMRRMGIEGISPRSWVPVTTIPGTMPHSLPDLVKRTWDQGELNKVWISDTTYLRTGEGWLYLCAIRDGHSRRVLGWAMDSTHTADLVERALRMAHTLRGEVPEGVVFHADRGTQWGCPPHGGHPREPLQAGARWVVERTNSWHNRGFKKLAICTERRGRVIEALIALANSVIILRRLIREGWTTYRWDTRPTRRP